MNPRILLIEDNAHSAYLAGFLLRARGWQVHHAPDGASGLRLAAECDPALIVLDIQLPGLDGHALARQLKADPALAAIPIVAVTSFAMPGDRRSVLASGCQDCIEKPIDPATFVDLLEAHLRPEHRQKPT